MTPRLDGVIDAWLWRRFKIDITSAAFGGRSDNRGLRLSSLPFARWNPLLPDRHV
jgi:hypothetical protein